MATEGRAPWEVIRAAADELDAVLDGDLGNEWVHQAGTGVVEPLVAWLREESKFIHGLRSQRVPLPRTQHALDFARRVLGERGP